MNSLLQISGSELLFDAKLNIVWDRRLCLTIAGAYPTVVDVVFERLEKDFTDEFCHIPELTILDASEQVIAERVKIVFDQNVSISDLITKEISRKVIQTFFNQDEFGTYQRNDLKLSERVVHEFGRRYPTGEYLFKNGEAIWDHLCSLIPDLHRRGGPRYIARIIAEHPDILLWSSGFYIHKCNIDPDLSLVDEIIDECIGIFDSGISDLKVHLLFERNRERLLRSHILSSQALYSLLRLRNSARLSLDDYPRIQDATKGGDSRFLTDIVEDFVHSHHGVVSRKEIVNHFCQERGWRSYELEQAIQRCPNIFSVGSLTYAHRDALKISQHALSALVSRIEIELQLLPYFHIRYLRVKYPILWKDVSSRNLDGRSMIKLLSEVADPPFRINGLCLATQESAAEKVSDEISDWVLEAGTYVSIQQLEQEFCVNRGFPSQSLRQSLNWSDLISCYEDCYVHSETIGIYDDTLEKLQDLLIETFYQKGVPSKGYVSFQMVVEMAVDRLGQLKMDFEWNIYLLAHLTQKLDIALVFNEAYVLADNALDILDLDDLIGFIIAHVFNSYRADLKELEKYLKSNGIIELGGSIKRADLFFDGSSIELGDAETAVLLSKVGREIPYRMSLRELSLGTTYCSIETDLYGQLIAPLLARSVKYDRAVGFFSSLWLKEVANGLAQFVSNRGVARIVTSIQLSSQDWDAIRAGGLAVEPNAQIEYSVNQVLDELQKQLEHRTLGALSWLISNRILDFRFSVPIGRLEGGILHSKMALFYDANKDGVAVFGSQNDSSQAAVNEETLSVFTSWGDGKTYFLDYQRSFEQKWNADNDVLKSYPIPEAARENIIRIGKPFEELFCSDLGLDDASQSQNTGKKLRAYQQTAIDAWFENQCQGLFEMATGSGKTFTAISAATRLLKDRGDLAVVVLAPFTHLVEQWASELRVSGINPVICTGGFSEWLATANSQLLEFRAGVTQTLCLVTTHSTASGDKFSEFVARIPRPWLLIADEAHGLGAAKQRKALFPEADYRIGLSATASRWFDEEGTSFIRQYFKATIIEYGLKEAIEAGSLSSYSYFPVCTELTELELEEYLSLTKQISLAISRSDIEDDAVQYLLRKRAKILGSAAEKLPALMKLVSGHQREALQTGSKYLHNLYYCSPGDHERVVSSLDSLGLKVHKFVYDVPQNERMGILEAFSAGELDGIVAIKCLDEGVDIPATRRAYIMASTTNPREFVQRRGRLLRNYPGKPAPELYDFVIGPWGTANSYNRELAKSLLMRELPRVVEFSSLSRNKHTATTEIYEVCKYYGLGAFLYQEPWEVYRSMKGLEPDIRED